MNSLFNDSQKKILREAFRLFDVDGNGLLSKEQLSFMLKEMGMSQAETNELIQQECFRQGSIDQSAFLDLMIKKMSSMGQQRDIKEAFKILDADQDGFITFGQLKDMLLELGEKVTDDDVHNMIKQADFDGDKRVSYEQFQKLMMS